MKFKKLMGGYRKKISLQARNSAFLGIAGITSPVPREIWKAIYCSDMDAMPTQSPDWAAAVVSYAGFGDASRLYEFTDGCHAVLPLFYRPTALGKWAAFRSPPAAWGFGGLVADTPLSAAHIGVVLADLAGTSAILTHIRPNPLQAGLWRDAAPNGWRAIPKLAHILDLAGGYEHVWEKKLRPNTRNLVRRAERAGLNIEFGAEDRHIDAFYELLRLSFARWARRQREPLALSRWRGHRRDPKAKFRALAHLMGLSFRLWVARVGAEPAAAILVLQDRQAHYTRGAMNEELAGPTSANYLLHSLAIKEACRQGCRHYHMGETGSSSSLALFKSRFGADATPYAEYRLERLPISWIDEHARALIKRIIGFRDA
jgi:hypothetical protein